MKKLRLLLGLLICTVLLFSCRKPIEGDDPGTWMATDSVHLVGTCSIVGDLDLGVYTITLDPSTVSADAVRLEKVELVYCEGNQELDSVAAGELHRVEILKDAVLKQIYTRSDTIRNLTPGTTYSYQLIITDAVFSDATPRKTFQTLQNIESVVKMDTVYVSSGRVECRASVTAHWRALLDDPGYTLSLFLGSTPAAIDQEIEDVEIVYDSLVGMTVKKGFGGHVAVGADVSLWFRAYVKDSWGKEAYSDTAQFVMSSQPFVVIVKHDQLDPVSYRIKGNTVQGTEDVLLYQCGFCYGFNPTPTINDSYVVSTTTQWGPYTCDLTNLEHNTTYYYRAFIQITDENGPIYYSEGSGQFTTDAEVVPIELEMIDLSDIYTNPSLPLPFPLIEPTSAYVLGRIVNGALDDVREYGFVWQKAVDVNGEIDLFNCLGHVTGIDASQVQMLALLVGSLDGAFLQQITGLESETEYIVRAYAKLKTGGETYSEPILLKMPGE